MRKLILCAAIVAFAFTNVNAQEFKAGINAALPIGDAGDLSTFGLALDVAYLFEVSEEFNVGPSIGYNHSFGDSDIIDEDFSWLPIAAAGRYSVSEEFTLGADLGYAIGISPDGVDGGFYYAPRVQYGVSEALDIVLAYRGISLDGITWSQITLGVEFGL